MRFLRAAAAALAMAMATPAQAAEVDDLAIGSLVKGAGPTIIFVHGYTCDLSVWDDQIDAFANDYRVVALDLPGHGNSDVPALDAFSMNLFARSIEAVRDELSAEKVILVGHSMGALVIRQYATLFPDRVAGLVSVDGVLDPRAFANQPAVDVTPQLRAGMIEGFFSDATSEDMRNEIRNMMLNSSPVTAQGALNAMLDPSLITDDVLDAPTLDILAATARERDADAMREFLPDYAQIRMEDTGHFLMMEKPEAFNELLAKFLDERAQF